MSLGMTLGSILPVAAGGGYTAQGVHFDGTNDYMTASALSGIADGQLGILSFWFKMNGGDGNYQILMEDRSGGGYIQLGRDSSNKWYYFQNDSGGLQTWGFITTSTFLSGGGWHHILASWSTNAIGGLFYVDGVNDTNVFFTSGRIINYLATDTHYDFAARNGPSLLCNIDIADFYWNTTEYLDLSVTANREKFILAGHPVDLGANGATPTGTSPMIFFHGATASWHTNDGTGGGFTLTGALTDAATNP